VTIKVPIDKAYIYKNDKKIINDSKAVIVNSRTYLPIRVVMEAFNYQVKRDENSRSILIDRKNRRKNEDNIMPLHRNITRDNKKIKINGYKINLKNN